MKKGVHQLVDHLFRHEYGSLVAGLTARFGPRHVEWIEDAVQEALLRAMRVWPFEGVPVNPEGWLYQVANRQMIDRLRRENKSVEMDAIKEEREEPAPIRTGKEIEDEQLKMIFACCNSRLEERDALMLSLKLIGGFSIREVARALLLTDEAAKKSVQRARERFHKRVESLYFPQGKDLEQYLDRVLKVIYLIFNEGYKSSSGKELVKEDICGEAIRLALLLSRHSYCSVPRVFSLLSLMSFKASRFAARTGKQGELILLEEQDRNLWNAELIRWGFYYFNRAATKNELSAYQLEAAIEFQYHAAPSHSTIDWPAVLKIYELLLKQRPGPFTQLNYLVIFEKVHGAEMALPKVLKLEANLGHHHLYHAVCAHFEEKLGNQPRARQRLMKALEYVSNEVERRHLEDKLARLQEPKS